MPTRLIKYTVIALAVIIYSLDPVAAQQRDCVASYYRSKQRACLDEVLGLLKQSQDGRTDPNTMMGFLAQVFRDSPSERERILKAETSDYVKSIDLVMLHRAGLADEAQKFAAANNLTALNDKLRAARLVALDALQPSSTPADNDLLVGAYMASGNTTFIKNILLNYAGAEDGMVSDGLRIGLMMGTFGTNLAPKGREPAIVQAACAKYQCRTDQTKFLRVMTLGTAIWSLRSLAEKDDGIKKTLAGFFASDARLKNLYAVEQNAFANYVTFIVVLTAVKEDQPGVNRDTNASIKKSATIYENLGPPNEAFPPLNK